MKNFNIITIESEHVYNPELSSNSWAEQAFDNWFKEIDVIVQTPFNFNNNYLENIDKTMYRRFKELHINYQTRKGIPDRVIYNPNKINPIQECTSFPVFSFWEVKNYGNDGLTGVQAEWAKMVTQKGFFYFVAYIKKHLTKLPKAIQQLREMTKTGITIEPKEVMLIDEDTLKREWAEEKNKGIYEHKYNNFVNSQLNTLDDSDKYYIYKERAWNIVDIWSKYCNFNRGYNFYWRRLEDNKTPLNSDFPSLPDNVYKEIMKDINKYK